MIQYLVHSLGALTDDYVFESCKLGYTALRMDETKPTLHLNT